MSMCGHLTKKDKEKWAEKNRQAQVDSAAKWEAEQKSAASAGSPPALQGSPEGGSPKSRSGSPPAHSVPAGRDLTMCTPAERAAHRQAMLDAHKERFKDAHWTHTIPILEGAKTEDVLRESVAVRLHGHNAKFVKAPEMLSVSRAPRDVDNHLFTGAVHKEAESEQEIIARKIENHQMEIADHKGREKLKDEMDNLRRGRSSTWSDKAIPTQDGEVPL